MIIERDIAPYLIVATEPMSVALDKITANKSRFIVCVSENGALEGVLTDGDFRHPNDLERREGGLCMGFGADWRRWQSMNL